MARIVVSTVIAAPPAVVWSDIEDVASHVGWMADAVAIRFLGDRHAGVGTLFECDTRVGPFTLTDVMEITEWEPARRMGVRHVGVVTGDGVFTLTETAAGATEFVWREGLTFPWWLGGPVGAAVGGQVLRLVWARNLRRLRSRLEPVPA